MIHLTERVTGRVLERFLAARGVPERCPMCGADEMSVSVFNPDDLAAGANAPAVRVVHMLDDGSRRGYGQFLRVCTHCGHIHYIRDLEVLAFLDEEGENG